MGSASLPEVHSSVGTKQIGFWRRLMAFTGPAYLVSVGYMDPGNWATDLEGGARFGYQLLWVLVVSNFMAILLQTLSARLGIVAGRDLAQACRESYPQRVSYALWILCEIAIAACDLAEVLGAAIALNLLFKIPLIAGVLVTAADILLVLWFSRYGIRMIEAIVLSLIAVITACFLIELWMAKPVFGDMLTGLVPRLTDQSLYVAIGILGATVMPHNLYLHSALVQTRRFGSSVAEKRMACKFNLIDSVVALNGALIVNAAILILAASVFFKRQIVVTEIQQAHLLLSPLLGAGAASVLFAVALLASGQSSTLTGTMAGQIVMEGFLDLRMRPWLRRLITRLIAIIPAVLVIHFAGEHGTYSLLILSQVILSLQLPFAVIPLVRFTSDKQRMGEFANARWVKLLAWTSAALIIGLNARLVWTTVEGWSESNGGWVWLAMGPAIAALAGLLLWISFTSASKRPEAAHATPGLTGTVDQDGVADLGKKVVADLPVPVYARILVPLDHSERDRVAIAHAVALGRAHGATLYLFHVEEGVTSVLFGAEASTAEIAEGERYFTSIVDSLVSQGIASKLVVVHGKPRQEIVKYARALSPDLVVMGAHGHRGLKDLIYGATINAVRHEVNAPVLVVGE